MKQYIEQVIPPLLDEEISYLRQRKSCNPDNKNTLSCPSVTTGEMGEKLVEIYLLSNGKWLSKPVVDHGVDRFIYSVEDPRTHKLAQVKEIYRIDEDVKSEKDRGAFVFSFQSDGHLNTRKNTRDNVDIFYSTFVTKHRQLIFEIPSSIVPLTSKNNRDFITFKKARLDRSYSYSGDSPDICYKDYLVHELYDEKIRETFPNFFKPKKTLSEFLE